MACRLSPSETYHLPLPDEIGRTFLTLPDSSKIDNICLLRSTSMRGKSASPSASVAPSDSTAVDSPGCSSHPRLFFHLLFRLPGQPFERDKVRKSYCQQTHQTKRPKQHGVVESPTAICEFSPFDPHTIVMAIHSPLINSMRTWSRYELSPEGRFTAR